MKFSSEPERTLKAPFVPRPNISGEVVHKAMFRAKIVTASAILDQHAPDAFGHIGCYPVHAARTVAGRGGQ